MRIGFHAARNSYLWCDGSVVEQASSGFEAHSNGVVWNHGSAPSGALPQGRRGKAYNCEIGIQAVWGGLVYAPMAIAESCNIGFRVIDGATLLANGGWAKNCQVGFEASNSSYLEAYDTRAASTGCPTVYSPGGSSVAGNANGVINFN